MDIVRFLKNWTLPVAIATGVSMYLVFAFIPALDSASRVLAPLCDAFLPVFMFLVLFVTFCKVDFRKLRPVKWHMWVAAFQILFVSLIVTAVLLFHIKGNDLILLEALLTCIIAPTASAAPVVTQKLGGNLEEMTAYTFISNALTAVMIPICFPMIDKMADISFTDAFLKMLHEMCMVLLMPMVCAYIAKHYMHSFHRWVTSIKDLSYYLWGCSLMMVSGVTIRNILHADTSAMFLAMIAILGMLVCIIQFAVGRYVGHFFGSTVNAGQGLGQKNTVVAIWAATAYLNPLSTVGPGCYILWQNIINSIEIWQKRLNDAKAEVKL